MCVFEKRNNLLIFFSVMFRLYDTDGNGCLDSSVNLFHFGMLVWIILICNFTTYTSTEHLGDGNIKGHFHSNTAVKQNTRVWYFSPTWCTIKHKSTMESSIYAPFSSTKCERNVKKEERGSASHVVQLGLDDTITTLQLKLIEPLQWTRCN